MVAKKARKLVKGVLVVAGLLFCASLMTGCETDQLKKDNANLTAQLQRCQTDNQTLTQQNQALSQQLGNSQAENEQLRAQLAKGPAGSRISGHPLGENTGAKEKFGGEEVTETAHAITVTLPEAILFDSGKAVLKESSKARLAKIAAVIKKSYAGKEIRVEGHTDTDPIKKSHFADNWQLSTERALAVVRDLTKAGIVEPRHICAVGFGEFAPKGADKAKNRRVEIVILK